MKPKNQRGLQPHTDVFKIGPSNYGTNKDPQRSSITMEESRQKKMNALLKLSHELGSPRRQMAILGEGNTSVRLTQETFLVKASGSSLSTLTRQDVVECKAKNLLSLLERKRLGDEEIDAAL